jgi:predicted histidine transporter YuiF (NhaC family)
MMALLAGVGSLALGIILIVFFRGEFVDLLQGGIPIMLILGGALAAYLGYEEIKEKKGEVESLKEEIKELKGEKPETEKSEE